jgi:hypothetical protein
MTVGAVDRIAPVDSQGDVNAAVPSIPSAAVDPAG